jgi:hypothetical protein
MKRRIFWKTCRQLGFCGLVVAVCYGVAVLTAAGNYWAAVGLGGPALFAGFYWVNWMGRFDR